ncbi:hypothetical protein ACPXB3_17405 [Gordonia sp. DT219]|uniref:hypothetical protein n=1 Tax=Gordonia sp. DT219 TaxID=3416658 RepID=UPI003CF77C4F
MGAPHQLSVDAWLADPRVGAEIRWKHAAPSGLRFGRRSLGIGLDSLLLAMMARLGRAGPPYLCANPWTAVALRLVGISQFAVTGIYSTPEGRTWKLLRRAIGTNPVVTLVDIESSIWNGAGGHSTAVLYGNTFGYPRSADVRNEAAPARIFVGGTSDRDPALVEALVEQLAIAGYLTEVIIADGSGPDSEIRGNCNVTRMPQVTPEKFGPLLASCEVVFLPLVDSGRAAGHMVTVGALEAGLRVLTSDVRGMEGYVDGFFVQYLSADGLFAKQIQEAVAIASATAPSVRDYWRQKFSTEAYAGRVMDAIAWLVAH